MSSESLTIYREGMLEIDRPSDEEGAVRRLGVASVAGRDRPATRSAQ